MHHIDQRLCEKLLGAVLALLLFSSLPAFAQSATPTPNAPQATPSKPSTEPIDSATQGAPARAKSSAAEPSPPSSAAQGGGEAPASPATKPQPPSVSQATPEGVPLAPEGKKQTNEIEPTTTPTVPENATTENVVVPARPIVVATGQSSYDEAFKAIKASLEVVKASMQKAGLQPTGHPIAIFSAPDDKGFKYQAGVPIKEKPASGDVGNGVTVAMSPSGKAIKFQHRGAYDDIDSTYDVITAYLDAKGLQVDSPYIEEYLNDLSTADDPNLQVDIYVFVK